MQRINEGYFDQRVEAQTKDEIGQLSGTFNMMAEGLKERQIIDELGRDLSSTFQFNKLTSLVRDSLRNAIGAKNVRLYVHDQSKTNTYHEITNPDSESHTFPPIQLSENVKNYITSEISGFMIHDTTKKIVRELNHSADAEPGLVLPMMIKDQLFGMLFFALPDERNSFTDKERKFAGTLAAQVTLALENAILYDQLREQERIKRELEIAREVQQQLLPSSMPKLDGYSIQGVCRSAFEVGGDYFDFFTLENNNLGIVIADVSGKGTSASFYMAELKGLMMPLSSAIASPRSLLIDLNHKLLGNIDRQSFISMIYGIINPTTRKFTFARAGHNALLKLGQNGKHFFLTPGGIGLGLAAGEKFVNNLEETSISIVKDDLLIFYTDGITEAMNEHNEEYGEDRLLEVTLMSKAKTVADIQADILDSVDEFLGTRQAQDDQTMIIVKCLK